MSYLQDDVWIWEGPEPHELRAKQALALVWWGLSSRILPGQGSAERARGLKIHFEKSVPLYCLKPLLEKKDASFCQLSLDESLGAFPRVGVHCSLTVVLNARRAQPFA